MEIKDLLLHLEQLDELLVKVVEEQELLDIDYIDRERNKFIIYYNDDRKEEYII